MLVGGMTPRYPQSIYIQGQQVKPKNKQGPGRLEQGCRLERSRPDPGSHVSRTVRLEPSRIHQPTSPYKRASTHSTGVGEQYSLSGGITTRHDDLAGAGRTVADVIRLNL